MRGLAPRLISMLVRAAQSFGPKKETATKGMVLVLHGIMNKKLVTEPLARTIRAAGYAVDNWGYPSTGGLIEEHSARLNDSVQSLPKDLPVYLVGFSQGAIIIRYTLTHYALPQVRRVVMIAPPNHGCEMAEDFYQYAWFRGLYGDKSIKQLFAKQNDFLKNVGIPEVEFGIIAGGKGDDIGYSRRIPGDDDGTISVESTKLEGARDFIVLPYQHTPLVWAPETAQQTIHFLENGAFTH
jgi:triacylglycerol lipase